MSDDTVTLSRADYEAMVDRIEDLEATIAYDRAIRTDDGTRIPADVVNAEILDGDHPIAAWRRYRGLTLRQLAERSGVNDAYLSEIENGRKPGSALAYKAVSQALDVPLDALIPEPDQLHRETNDPKN